MLAEIAVPQVVLIQVQTVHTVRSRVRNKKRERNYTRTYTGTNMCGRREYRGGARVGCVGGLEWCEWVRVVGGGVC